jgi:hypothetical protein
VVPIAVGMYPLLAGAEKDADDFQNGFLSL